MVTAIHWLQMRHECHILSWFGNIIINIRLRFSCDDSRGIHPKFTRTRYRDILKCRSLNGCARQVSCSGSSKQSRLINITGYLPFIIFIDVRPLVVAPLTRTIRLS